MRYAFAVVLVAEAKLDRCLASAPDPMIARSIDADGLQAEFETNFVWSKLVRVVDECFGP